ncbi:hypothetical protein KP509_17G058100 [Ceratopteris richardii]|uniref:EF-hand domain-containing protein n=1 Tax=Ceratopteris richardii TaxID=49495 RepID=A0A8T2SY23_CERRI|nr:hypothetical protein KP509_17G058100 [Ceratopteris richardii]
MLSGLRFPCGARDAGISTRFDFAWPCARSSMADQAALRSRLQRVAILYYERLPYSLQQQLYNAFRAMDRNRDGRISQLELVQWGPWQDFCRSFSKDFPFSSFISSLFSLLDADNSGELDFDECKGLFFVLITPSEFCDHCGKLILESVYACVECRSLMEKGILSQSFDLCATCYGAGKDLRPFQNPRPKVLHPHTNFMEGQGKLMIAMEEILDQIQCSVCKTYHRGNVRGALIGSHIHTFNDNVAVCEWCIASPCSLCGNFFQGVLGTASSGGWAVNGFLICKDCQPFRTMSRNALPNNPFSEEFLRKLASSEVFEECSTCITKAKDGTLMNEIVQGISLSAQRAYSTPFFSTAGTSAPQYRSTDRHYSPNYGPRAPYFSQGGAPSPHFPYAHPAPQLPQNGAPSPHFSFSNYTHPFSYSPAPTESAYQTQNSFGDYGDFSNSGFGPMGQNLPSFYGQDPNNTQGLMDTIQSIFSTIGGGSNLNGFLDLTAMASNIGNVVQLLSMTAGGCSIM